jgi:septal ring factor EnvC (AmiA/AmiB activator)
MPRAPALFRSLSPADPFGRRVRVSGVLLLLGLSLGPLRPVLGIEDPDPAIEAHEQDLKTVEQRVQSIGAELAGKNAERQALIAELEGRERDVAALALAGRELARTVKEQTRIAAGLRARQMEEQGTLATELERLSGLLRMAYTLGRADALRLLLNQEDPVRASRMLSYFAYFNRERVRRIDAVESRAERLAALAKGAEREGARLAELADRQEATRTRLDDAKAQRAQVLAELERIIASGEETMAGLSRDAENLRLLVEHLRQRAQIGAELDVRRDPFAARRGQLQWPLPEGRVRAGFGSPKEGTELAWDGVLLAAREGEEVRAVYDGRVVYADWMLGFGMLLAIDHGDGYITLYGNNEALLKEVGEWVSTGEPIALGGRSGGRDEPVLYFAIRHNGDPVDPAVWCG